jgi:parallel beta-helix repeat protein
VNNNTGTGNVKLSGTNLFSGNTLDGLRVVSAGSITSSGKVTAESNGQYGFFLRNTAGTGSISLGGTIVVSQNTWDGLRAVSNADIAISADLTASDNLHHGALLNNSSGSGNIAFTGANIFNGNKWNGLRVLSAGNITSTNSLTAKDNSFGVYLDNTAGTGYVKLEGTNTFSDNRRDGVFIKSNGNITVKNATASTNKQNGFNLQTTIGITALWCGVGENNGMYGVNVTQNKELDLFGMTFNGNTLGDVNVDGGKVYHGHCDGRLYKRPCSDEETTSAQKTDIKVVSVTGAQGQFGLDCQRYGGTKLLLPNGDFVFIPCPIGEEASLKSLPDVTQPLPPGSTFEAGLTLEITADGGRTSSVDGIMTISFMIPEDKADADLAILFWNGNEWVEVENAKLKNGHLEAQVDYTGMFALVSQ